MRKILFLAHGSRNFSEYEGDMRKPVRTIKLRAGAASSTGKSLIRDQRIKPPSQIEAIIIDFRQFSSRIYVFVRIDFLKSFRLRNDKINPR